MIPQFSFTRVPSVKVRASVELSGLVTANNTLVLVGRVATGGGTATVGQPLQIQNYGDPVAAAAECAAAFGANSELGGMVVAAIAGILYSDLVSKGYPPIVVLPMAAGAASSTLAAALAPNLNLPAPYIVFPFDATDAVALAAAQAHAEAISAEDRGDNGQFGSFAFLATNAATAAATPAGLSAASQNVAIPWLRDTAATPANPTPNVAAAYGAVCASLGVPYLPLTGVRVGGLVPPANAADYHSPGDTGTVALGLSAGLSPLIVKGSFVAISRTITTQRTLPAVQDQAYFDMQDWQVLYYFRQNAYATASQPRYAQAKATDQKLKDLRSELIEIMDTFEDLEMFQYVQKFLGDFTINRVASNRSAAVYNLPVNVVPGFHNKGLNLVGTQQYDSLVVA